MPVGDQCNSGGGDLIKWKYKNETARKKTNITICVMSMDAIIIEIRRKFRGKSILKNLAVKRGLSSYRKSGWFAYIICIYYIKSPAGDGCKSRSVH